jgi:hypothetical protein
MIQENKRRIGRARRLEMTLIFLSWWLLNQCFRPVFDERRTLHLTLFGHFDDVKEVCWAHASFPREPGEEHKKDLFPFVVALYHHAFWLLLFFVRSSFKECVGA